MARARKVLITGGSGMIGSRLTTLLQEKGFDVAHLSRSRRSGDPVPVFLWNPAKQWIEKEALRDVDTIVHLAGAGIGEKRWTKKRKEEILQSRTRTTRLLYDTLAQQAHGTSAFVTASGINYYGLEDPGAPFTESAHPDKHDFMSQVTIAWEKEADAISSLGIRVVKLRTGVVLSRESIALKRISMPVRFFVGAPLGTGNQYFNWIHLEDICRIYLKAIDDASMKGPYNGVAPHPVTNRELTKQIAKALGRPLWLPPVPGFAAKLIAGEVAEIVLKGGKVSADKIQESGFKFQFPMLEDALQDIFSNAPTD